jgi:hypothetical protein
MFRLNTNGNEHVLRVSERKAQGKRSSRAKLGPVELRGEEILFSGKGQNVSK